MNIKEIQAKTLVRIIDDDEDLRESAEMMLSYAGWKVATYSDAFEFLTQDSPSVPGCAVVDIRMPGMSGPELQAEMLRRA
ncbi:response regulator, partial [uncultured Parasutterella sp.]|uniref:response regulator transcription factor n=1 Tax=uncultured Parasutterella sp. TaxID=1263098 RepID=UPI0025FBA7EA